MECDPRNNHHPIPFPLSQLLLTKSQNNCRPRLVIQIRPIQVRPIQVRAIHVRPPLSPLPSTSWSIFTGSSLRNCNPPSTAPQQPIPFDIGEEFGTAKRNLPPAKIVTIVLGVAAVVVAVFAFVQRAKPQGGGSIDNISAVEIPDQNAVLVALNVTIHNSAERP